MTGCLKGNSLNKDNELRFVAVSVSEAVIMSPKFNRK